MRRVVLVVLLCLVAFVFYRIVSRSGMLVTIEPRGSIECRAVGGVVGAEDVTIDAETMVAYLSADDRRRRLAGTPVRGEIYGLDLTREDSVPIPLSGGMPADFHPHGISLWRGPDGAKRLFVINHPLDGGHEVVIFDVRDDGLALVETVTYPDLSSPNDLVAVGSRQFYASNDRGYPEEGAMATLEAYLQLPVSSVSYFDGERGERAAGGLVFANGINASADGRTVYIAECLRRIVGIYDRDPASGGLTRRGTIDLGSCPDNIEVDEDGTLWIAAHPKLFDLIAHREDASKLAPSQILRVDSATGAVTEVLLDGGALISAASTASVAGDRMVVGAIFEDKVLVCERP
jgi:arylesterase/paraoxonase